MVIPVIPRFPIPPSGVDPPILLATVPRTTLTKFAIPKCGSGLYQNHRSYPWRWVWPAGAPCLGARGIGADRHPLNSARTVLSGIAAEGTRTAARELPKSPIVAGPLGTTSLPISAKDNGPAYSGSQERTIGFARAVWSGPPGPGSRHMAPAGRRSSFPRQRGRGG